MNQKNEVMESSSATLSGMNLNVVFEDETDYVFIDGELENEDVLAAMDDDDDDLEDEWDDCDLSPSLSCATSVATNVTLKDLNLIEENAMDVDDERMPSSDDMEVDDSEKLRLSNEDLTRKVFSSSNPKSGRRLSNKKLRKKMKMLKKAAAARAAAEALASQQKAEAAAIAELSSSSESSSTAGSDLPPRASSSKVSASTANSTKSKPSSPKRKSGNIAVACAQQTLAAYREEIEAGKLQKKTRAVSIDIS